MRNGAGRFEIGTRSFTHTFDAFGKLHSFKFYGNGSASMSARFLYTDFYNFSLADNNIKPFLTFEPLEPRLKGTEIPEAFIRNMDNTNVNIYRIFNAETDQFEYMALNDIWKVYQFNPRNLITMGPVTPDVDINKLVYVTITSSAHPVKEFKKETYITFLMTLSKVPDIKSNIRLFRMRSVSKREEIAKWDIEENRYMHSFALTKNYAVLIAPSIFISAAKLFTHANVYEAMTFNKTSKMNIYLVHLQTKNVTTIKVNSIFFMHHINAYEQNDNIIVDVCAFDNSSNVKMLQLKKLRDPLLRNIELFRNYIERIVINRQTFKVSHYPIPVYGNIPYSINIDMPTINEGYRHRYYCFAYGIAMKIDSVNINSYAVVKKDMCGKGRDLTWTMKYHYPSESYFVATPGGKQEDDGILLTHVFNGPSKQSYLLFLNATNMKPVSQSNLPTFVPMSFHGRFFQGDTR